MQLVVELNWPTRCLGSCKFNAKRYHLVRISANTRHQKHNTRSVFWGNMPAIPKVVLAVQSLPSQYTFRAQRVFVPQKSDESPRKFPSFVHRVVFAHFIRVMPCLELTFGSPVYCN